MDKFQYNNEFTHYSRLNRKNQTDAEKLLWQKLRNRQLSGFKFHRQYPIQVYILDFYCPEKKLAIELDGSQHVKNKLYDEKRTSVLSKYKIRVLRFMDNEMLQNTDSVLEVIQNTLMKS